MTWEEVVLKKLWFSIKIDKEVQVLDIMKDQVVKNLEKILKVLPFLVSLKNKGTITVLAQAIIEKIQMLLKIEL